MICPGCRADNEVDATFCEQCGARLEIRCVECGTAARSGARFCRKCGRLLAPAEAAPDPSPRQFTSPEIYTPRHLAERILTSRGALEGERKQVTVLFADVKASMELIADRNPEEARRILDPVLERMMEAVHQYEGTVNQVMGDGIMALFGAPLALEDHAVRACYAALRMQESVKRYADETRRAAALPIHIRVGLNAGEVVVRSIGSDLHMDYTAVGQTTHLAARMEQLATPGSILITADVFRLVEGYIEAAPLGPVPIKGLQQAVQVYEITGAGPVRTRLQAAAIRGLSRFVGREHELEQLAKAAAAARGGRGQVVAIVGDPGVGKSRLFFEFARSSHARDWLMLEADSVTYGRAVPYLPVIALLKAYFQIEDREEPRKIREKLTGKLLTLDDSLRSALPVFLTLLDLPVDDPEIQSFALDPLQRRRRTLEAVKRVFLRESQIQPLLLVFENLHWIDSESRAFLDSLIESLPTARILLLVNSRPEYRHDWAQKTYYTQLHIDPLPPQSASHLLEALLGTDASLEPLKQLLIQRTDGNPFFLEESVRTLAEAGVLLGDRGAYRLAVEVEDVQVPASVQAVLAERVDRLSPEDKRLLQSAAVIGKTLSLALLRAVVDVPEDELHAGLARLQAGEFLYESELFPDLEYTFKHALTQSVAYGSLLHERRRGLHARIVDAIEALAGDRLADRAEELGRHALQGEVWDRAVRYLRQAGAKAFGRSAYRDAVAWLEQAIVALGHVPEGPDTLRQHIDLLFGLRDSLLPIGEYERIRVHLADAQRLAEALQDQRRLGWIWCYVNNYCWLVAEHERGLDSGRRALRLAETQGDADLQIAAKVRLGQSYHGLGDYRQAVAFLQDVATSIGPGHDTERFGLPGPGSVWSRAWLAWSLSELGEFAAGVAAGREAMRIAESVDHGYSVLVGALGLGLVHLRQGDVELAIPLLERALSVCEQGDFSSVRVWVLSAMSGAYLGAGRAGELRPTLEAAVQQAATKSILYSHSNGLMALGEEYLAAGDLDRARDCGRTSLEMARARGERGNEGWSLRLLGEAHAGLGQLDDALRCYGDAAALAESQGMRPLLAHSRLGRGTVLSSLGRRDRARAELAAAAAGFRAQAMTRWVPRAEAELAASA
jgi:class 3 adenylate cyclase/tetratricopeptide (TPR) repeat protein